MPLATHDEFVPDCMSVHGEVPLLCWLQGKWASTDSTSRELRLLVDQGLQAVVSNQATVGNSLRGVQELHQALDGEVKRLSGSVSNRCTNLF